MRGNNFPISAGYFGHPGGLTPCTSVDEVQVICQIHRLARARLETGGGWRRTCVGRERRWPSFIIWRWAGRALDGWIRCRWRTPLPQLPPPRRRHSPITKNRRNAPGLPVREERRPRRLALKGRPRNPARELGRRAPRRRHEGLPPGRVPRSQRRSPPGRAPGGVPSAGNPRPVRVRLNQHPGGERRRAAGGANR
jgi:hypothetical protein